MQKMDFCIYEFCTLVRICWDKIFTNKSCFFVIFRLLETLETFCNIKNRPIPGYDENQREQNKIFI